MVPVIQHNLEKIADLCRDFRVRRLELVGSAARGTDFSEEASDADFLVDFMANVDDASIGGYFKFKDGLSDILGGKVDVIEVSAVKNPFILRQFADERELIYAA